MLTEKKNKNVVSNKVNKNDVSSIVEKVIDPITSDFNKLNSLLLSAVDKLNSAINLCRESKHIPDERYDRFLGLNEKVENSRLVTLKTLSVILKNIEKEKLAVIRAEKKIEKDREAVAKLTADLKKATEKKNKAEKDEKEISEKVKKSIAEKITS